MFKEKVELLMHYYNCKVGKNCIMYILPKHYNFKLYEKVILKYDENERYLFAEIVANYKNNEFLTRKIQTKLGIKVITKFMEYFDLDFKIKKPDNFERLALNDDVELKFEGIGDRLDYIILESYFDF